MMFWPGRLLFQISLPVFLLRQMKLGASGNGMLMWFSSTPLAVTTKSRSPTMSGEQSVMLCGKTFSSLIMSYDQITSPSVCVLYFSFWKPSLPLAKPLASRQTTSHRLEHVVDAIAVDDRGRAEAFARPVVDLAARQLVVDHLPEELARLLVEAHEDALVDRRAVGVVVGRLAAIAVVARVLVVGADEDLAAGDDRPAVGPAAERFLPLDPVAEYADLGVVLALGELVGESRLDQVDEVAAGRAAEHGVVAVAAPAAGGSSATTWRSRERVDVGDDQGGGSAREQ